MRLIEANELLDRFSMDDRDQVHVIQIGDVIDAVEGTPTVDPVKHGHWIFKPFPDDWVGQLYICSECNEISDSQSRYCSHCGAKMDAAAKRWTR